MIPNLIYDKETTERRQNASLDRVPRSKGIVLKDEMIVNANQRINEEDLQKLESLSVEISKENRTLGLKDTFITYMGRLLIIGILISYFFTFLSIFRSHIFEKWQMILVIALIYVFIIIIANLFVYQLDFSEFLIPVTVAAMLLTILFDARIGFMGTTSIVLLVGIMIGNDLIIEFMIPNLIYDKETTERRQNASLDRVPRSKGIVLKDEMIVNANQRINEEDLQKLESLSVEISKENRTLGLKDTFITYMGRLLIIGILISYFFTFLSIFRSHIFEKWQMILVIALIYVFIIIIANLFVYQLDFSEFLIPVTVAAMLLTILFDARIGFMGTTSIVLLVGIMIGNDLIIEFMIPNLIYDKETTERRQTARLNRVPRYQGTVLKDERIVYMNKNVKKNEITTAMIIILPR
jgi:membrane-associated HD superfamily phosphohydrolase